MINRKKLFKIEIRNNLFELNFLGVHVYELIRLKILSPKTVPVSKNHLLARSRRPKYFFYILNLRNLLLFIFRFKKTDNAPIFISASRRNKTAKHVEDIYLDPILENLQDYWIIDFSRICCHTDIKRELRRRYINLHFILGVFSMLSSLISRVSLLYRFASLKAASDKIHSNLDNIAMYHLSDVNLPRLILYTAVYFRLNEFLGNCLFVGKCKRQAFFVGFLGFEGLIQASKNRGLVSYELQHGSPQKNKFNYDFSQEVTNLKYRCSAFLSWGSFFDSNIPLPYSRIIKFGFPQLSRLKKAFKVSEQTKLENSLLILSQPEVSVELLNEVEKFAFSNCAWHLVYKCHPYENINIAKKRLRRFENVNVVKDIQLLSLFHQCRYAVGVYSTALIEAKYFGLDVSILALKGSENMEDFIKSGYADRLSTLTDLKCQALGEQSEGLFYEYDQELLRSLGLKLKED